MAGRQTIENVVRLLIEAKGTAAVDDLKRKFDLTNGSINALNDSYRAGDVTLNEYMRNVASLARQQKQLADALKEVQAQTGASIPQIGTITKSTSDLKKEKQELAKATKKSALGFLEFSRAVEDAQYGVRGVLNNIPQMIMLFGGGAGLAAAISLAAVAAVQLGPKLANALNGPDMNKFDQTLSDLKAKIKAIDEKPLKLTADYAQVEAANKEIDRLNKALKAAEDLKNREKGVQKRSGEILSEAVAETGGGANLEAAIRSAMERNGMATNGLDQHLTRRQKLKGRLQEVEKDVALAEADPTADTTAIHSLRDSLKADLAKTEHEIEKGIQDNVKDIMGSFAKGSDLARRQVQQFMRENPEEFKRRGFDHRFESALMLGSQSEIAAADKDAQWVERQERMAKLNDTLKKNKEREEKQETKEQKAAKRVVGQYLKRQVDDVADRIKRFKTRNKFAATTQQKAQTKAQRDEARRLAKRARFAHMDTKEETQFLEQSFGADYVNQLQGALAMNSYVEGMGAPVARNAKQERRFQREGTVYALPDEEIVKRQKQSFAGFAGKQGMNVFAATAAADNMTDRAKTELNKKMMETQRMGMNNVQASMLIVSQLTREQGEMGRELQHQMQEIKAINRAVMGNRQQGALRRGQRN